MDKRKRAAVNKDLTNNCKADRNLTKLTPSVIFTSKRNLKSVNIDQNHTGVLLHFDYIAKQYQQYIMSIEINSS